MYALNLCLALAFAALASTFKLTAPVPGSTIDLSSHNVTIAWKTNSTDPVNMSLIFGGADFAISIDYPVLVADLQYFWDAEDTASDLARSNATFYTGSPFQIAAFQYIRETPAEAANSTYYPPNPPLMAMSNYSITNYPGPTSNATGIPPSSGSSVFASRFLVPAWSVAAGAFVISGWASFI